MFSLTVAAFIAVVKVILSQWDSQYFGLDEAENLKVFKKYCKKELFTETYISSLFEVIMSECCGHIVGVTEAEIYSRRARYDMPIDYFCEGSGYLDVSFTVFAECWKDGESTIKLMTVSMYDVLSRADGEKVLNAGKNSGAYKTWKE